MKAYLLATLLFAPMIATASAYGSDPQPAPAPAPAPVGLTSSIVNDEGEALLTDSFQRTLYIFDIDQGSPSSNCNADCAEVWPPYIVNAGDLPKVAAPLATIKRANGKLQLTYEGHPVYTYAFDRTVGDDKGDGVGGVWHYIEVK